MLLMSYKNGMTKVVTGYVLKNESTDIYAGLCNHVDWETQIHRNTESG